MAAEDEQLIDASLYPLLVGALLPSSLLALDFLNPFSGSRAVLWKIPETAIIGLLIMLAIRADSVRFALLDQLRTRKLLLIARYAAMMGLGSALTGSLLTVWFWYRFDHDTSWLLRNAELQFYIGIRTSAYFGILLLGLSWAARVRIMRRQLGSTRLVRAETIVFAIIGVLGFILLSLRGWAPLRRGSRCRCRLGGAAFARARTVAQMLWVKYVIKNKPGSKFVRRGDGG